MKERKIILLVEDNKDILLLNSKVLIREGYTVLTAETLAEAKGKIIDSSIDLIILDIILPDGSGLDFCEDLRRTCTTPVLFLTSKRESVDIINGLKSGGDDYITKPYKLDELVARVKAQLRRSEYALHSASQSDGANTIEYGPIKLDLLQLVAYVNGKDICLTPKEFNLLQVLIKNKEVAISTSDLFRTVWGESLPEDPRLVWTHISRLRTKMGIDSNSNINIAAERGFGYLLHMD